MSPSGKPDVQKLKDNDSVEGLIEALGCHQNQDIRRDAAEALGEIGDKSAVAPLIEAMGDSDKEVRKSAVHALGKIGSDAVDPLCAALQHPSPMVREAAVRALFIIGDTRALEPLNGAFRDPDKMVRFNVVRLQGQIGNFYAVDHLIAALEDTDGKIRGAAVQALGMSRDVRAIPYLVNMLGQSGNAEKALAGFGVPAIDPLCAALQNPSARVRKAAIRALVRIDDPRVGGPLAATLGDSDTDVHDEALKAFVRIGDFYPVNSLITLLRDSSDETIRQRALSSLGSCGDVLAADPIIAAMKGPDKFLRRNAAQPLVCAVAKGIIDKDHAKDILTAALKDPDKDVRSSSKLALVLLGDGDELRLAQIRHGIDILNAAYRMV